MLAYECRKIKNCYNTIRTIEALLIKLTFLGADARTGLLFLWLLTPLFYVICPSGVEGILLPTYLHSTVVQYPHCQLFVFFLWMMFSSVSMDGVVSSNSSSRNHHDVLETCVKTKGSESLRKAEDLLFSYHVPRHVSWQYALGVYYASCDCFRQGCKPEWNQVHSSCSSSTMEYIHASTEVAETTLLLFSPSLLVSVVNLNKSLHLHFRGKGMSEYWLWKWKWDCSVAESCPTLETPWMIAHQAPLSMGFPRQKYWSGCHFLLQKMKLEYC